MESDHLRFADEAATRRWSACLARALAPIALAEQGFAIHLSGDLGAGKTTVVRHLLAALGIAGPVKSPSFALLESYNGPSFDVYHFDLYRFSSAEQWVDAGFDEIVAGAGLVLVEWPEQAAGALPVPDLLVRLALDEAEIAGADDLPGADNPAVDAPRTVAIAALSEAGRRCLTDVARCWSRAAPG
jgi:tRNA threonylcarbamoyladenosine biosynthesis protein TsaE